MVQSDYDYQSIALGIHQEFIELDLFHYGAQVFSEQDFIDAGLTAEDRALLQYMALQEAGHASLLADMLGESAPKQCTYNYPFKTVREYIDFNVRLTRWGESGNWGFLSHLDSKEVATLLVQAEAIEARQQSVFRQWLGLHPMPIWFAPGEIYMVITFLCHGLTGNRRHPSILALDSAFSVHQLLSGEQHSSGLAKFPQSPRFQPAKCE